MNQKNKMFLGKSEEKCWLPLIATMIDGHNLAWQLSNGEDVMYCKALALQHDLLVPLYVDSGVFDINTFNKLFIVFSYVIEFVYGNPNLPSGSKTYSHYITTEEFFNNIKKHWNDNIQAEIVKAEKKQKRI